MKNYAGNTPMVDITYRYNGKVGHVFTKLEYYNPSGSIKDRIAEYMLNKAVETGKLKEGQPIVETTSGNTGIALAAYAALTKHPVHIFMPSWASEERKKLMQMYGATLHLVSKEEGGFVGALNKADELAKEIGAYKLDQFANEDNTRAHQETTAVEILKQIPGVTDFVSGVGSGGTLMGVGGILSKKTGAKLIAIEPECSQVLAGKKIEKQHKIEGIGDDFIPKLVNMKLINSLLPINDDDAVAMASKLATELGLGVGISSGANFLGAVLSNVNDNQKIATVFADDNKKYLSTSLSNPIITEDMLTNKIELLDVERI